MAAIVPNPESPETGRSKAGISAYVWIAVAIAAVVAAIVFVMLRTEHRARETASANLQTPPPPVSGETSLIDFTPQDVKVESGWTILSGRRPTVTFTCRLASPSRPSDVAVLCYRTLGSDECLTTETHPRRDHTCRLTLRDLSPDMPYECFFIVSTRDTMVQSGTVRFTTVQN